jgi:hypothetical protein
VAPQLLWQQPTNEYLWGTPAGVPFFYGIYMAGGPPRWMKNVSDYRPPITDYVFLRGVFVSVRYFSLEEANALLPELRPLVGKLLERRARVARVSRGLGNFWQDTSSDIGHPAASRLVNEFVAIENLVERIHSYGCVIKSLEAGLVDFLSLHDGRDVYLCWRYDEPKIEYYHELHTGFGGRKPL